MPDRFANHQTALTSPPTGLFQITPDDANDLPQAIRGLNVAVTGDVQVTTVDGQTGTVHVAAGQVFPIRARRVWSTGTTATGLRGLY